ncbi:MAG: hypothetical protein IT232_06095 [Flavobacteriales bacterium]|nr:hypothetical protein [Flavobacteriales bacterium]
MKNVKKSLLALCLGVITIVGCKKEEKTPEPTPPATGGTPPPACNCGIVVSKNPATVKVTLQNTCSNNTQEFTVSYSVMNNASNGDTICMDSGTSW